MRQGDGASQAKRAAAMDGWQRTASVPRFCLLGRTDARPCSIRHRRILGLSRSPMQLEPVPIRCGWALALRERLLNTREREERPQQLGRSAYTPHTSAAKNSRGGDARLEIEEKRCCDTLWASVGW